MGPDTQSPDLPLTQEPVASVGDKIALNQQLRDALASVKVQQDERLRQMNEENDHKRLDNETNRLVAELQAAQSQAEQHGTVLTGIAAMRATAVAVSEPSAVDDTSNVEAQPAVSPEDTVQQTSAAPDAPVMSVDPADQPVIDDGLDLPTPGTNGVSQ